MHKKRTPGYIPRHLYYAGEVTVRTTNCVRVIPPIIHHKRKADVTMRTVVALMVVGISSLLTLTASVTG